MNIEPTGPGVSGRTRATVAAGGSFAQAAAAGGAAVLAIIGLAGTLTDYMMSIATIALGGAFLLHAGGVASQYLGPASRDSDDLPASVVNGGLTATSVAGMNAIALGILALLGIGLMSLVPSAIIVLSGALMMDGAMSTEPTAISYQQRIEESFGGRRFAVNGGDILVGLGGATLGIVALVGISTVTLSLVALLALGISTFLTGSTLGAKLMRAR
jgi:hypothetical protein